MTKYEVDISINDADTGAEVLRVTVTRESVGAALSGAAQGAEAVLRALTSGSGVLVVPPELSWGDKIPTDRAYCLTHDQMWNATGHDAQAWCSTREATQQEIDEADLAVEDREFTTEPLEIEQMEQRVIGVDLVEDQPPTIVEGTVRDGVLHIGVPRGTDPNALGRIVEAEIAKGNVEPGDIIASLPEEIRPAPSPSQALIDRMVQENLRAAERIYARGDLTPLPHIEEG